VPHILLVDDEPDLVEVCTMVLEELGHTVAGVERGQQALEAARRRVPALVVLDWVMPGCDGGAVLAALRTDRITASVPVLAISALADGAARARAAGATAFLAKPFDAEQLTAAVTAVLAEAGGATK
jgi:CheY-like chemotaxis protein